MSREYSVNETHALSHSMEQMYVNTPVAKSSQSNGLKTFLGSAPLSPPPTVDTRHKRERSESLMLYYTNESLTTKRRLRSRSRLGLDREDGLSLGLSSSMLTPCTTKPKERSYRQTEQLSHYPKNSENNLMQGDSSVFMTPCETPLQRQPLQCRDLNSIDTSTIERGTLSCNSSDYSSDSDSGSDTEFKAKLLTFDEEDAYQTPGPSAGTNICDSKLIGRRMGEKRVDFIRELVDLNCEEICKKIFCYLEPMNLQRVASVSKLWRRICKKDRIASPRLDHYIHGRRQHVLQKGKENLGHYTKFEHKISHRPPLSVKSNTLWTPEQPKSMKENETLENIKSNMMSVYEKMKCPVCGSPSRKLGDDVCECEQCHETFCQSCQRRMDERHKAAGKCALKVSHPNKGKGKERIGSKQSKSRLKRF